MANKPNGAKKTELLPWHPAMEIEEMERNFDRLLRDPFHFSPRFDWFSREMNWQPSVDVYEKENKIMVKADIPGMKMEDIDISVVGDTLRIQGEKKSESEVKEKDYYRSERSYGSFSRSVLLPFKADPKAIEANYDDGVLEIAISKPVEYKPSKVTVKKKASGKN